MEDPAEQSEASNVFEAMEDFWYPKFPIQKLFQKYRRIVFSRSKQLDLPFFERKRESKKCVQ